MSDPEINASQQRQKPATNPVATILRLVSENIRALSLDHRAFVVVNGVLAVLLLGVVLFAKDIATAKWATAGILPLFALNSVLVYLLARGKQRLRQVGDYDRRRKAADSVNGRWWQIILVRHNGEIQVEGLTIVDISLLVDVGYYGLGGELFDERGKSVAKWQAEAVAFKTLAPVELFYRFGGYTFRPPVLKHPTGDVTGIGTFTFDDAGDAKPAVRGSGWFASGDVEKLKFEGRREVRLFRINRDDGKLLEVNVDDPDSTARERLIAKRYRLLESQAPGSRVD